jgi:hypothetical protein
MKLIYGKQRKRLGRMEGFNLLLRIIKANKGVFIARACRFVRTIVTAENIDIRNDTGCDQCGRILPAPLHSENIPELPREGFRAVKPRLGMAFSFRPFHVEYRYQHFEWCHLFSLYHYAPSGHSTSAQHLII